MADQIIRSMMAERAYGSIYSNQYTDAAKSAKANEIARRIGVAPEIVESALPDMMAEDRLQRATAIAKTNETYAIMMSNPRFAAAAIDDKGIASLATATKELRETSKPNRRPSFGDRVRRHGPAGAVIRSFRDTLASASYSLGSGLAGLARMAVEAPDPVDLVIEAVAGANWFTRRGERSVLARGARDIQQKYQELREGSTVKYKNWYVDQAVRGFESAPLSVLALLSSVATRNPAFGIGLLSSVSGGESYGEARESGLSYSRALPYAVNQAGFEALGESLPIMRYVNDALKGSGFLKRLGGQIVTENLGEQITGHLQDFNAWATIDQNNGKTFGDYLNERPGAALAIAVSTTAAVGAQTSGAYALERAASRISERVNDRNHLSFLHRFMDSAAKAETRTATPSEFEDVLAQQLEGTPGETIYVPAVAVRSLFQSDADLSEDTFWGAYSEQISEAEALGGDIVIPTAAAATHLAGTPQWEQIKDQVRLSAGGSSREELTEWEAQFDEANQRTGEELAAFLAEERDAAEPVEKVYEEMRDKLMHAGYAADAASFLAVQFAQRARVRAERLGQTLTGTEADTIEIRQGATEQIEGRVFSEDVRGRITFTTDGRSIIDVFEGRDLSTVIHESGHLYLEQLSADAIEALNTDSDQARQLSADWDSVKAWFKSNGFEVGEDGSIPTEAHEMWARGFERYMMEGKAPSSTLRRAFEAFRSWLLTIYKVVDNLRSPITPEMRDVMARLMATDEELNAAAAEQKIKALFESAEEAGMTEAEFAEYQKATAEARDDAFDALLYRTMAPIRAARTKEFKDREATVKAEVAADIDALPLYRALRIMRQGEDGKPLRLSKEWLVNAYGEEILTELPTIVPVAKAEEADGDVIADLAGFSSGDEMIREMKGYADTKAALKDKGDKRSPRQAAIDEMTAAVMAERYGDPLRDGSIEAEARALIHNERQGEVISSEVRSLGRRTGNRPTPYAIARRWAHDKIQSGEVAEVISGAALQRYQRSARKAAQAAEAAMLAGDADEAFRQKQAQMLNNALIAEGSKAKDAIEAAVKRLGNTARRKVAKTIAQEYLDQAHQLLEGVEFRDRSQRSIDKQASFEEWAAEQRANGIDVITPTGLVLGQQHWSRMPVEQLLGLDATVKQILHLGRLKQILLDGKERREKDEIIAEMRATADAIGKGPPTALNDPDRSRWEALKSHLRGADAAMVKIEQLVDWLDRGNPNGVFNRMIFKPLAEAQGREADMMRDYVGRINALIEAMPKKQLREWRRRVDTPELINRIEGHPLQGEPWGFYKDQIVMIALNWGNEGNRQRLMEGYGWSEAQIQAVLDRTMTAEDWSFVQGTWDTINTLWPEVEALEKRVNGFAPEKVEAFPIATPFGSFRGGYFPAIYDPQWSSRADTQETESLLEGGYTRANVRSSATQARAERVRRPIMLSMQVVTRHLGEVIHDITHREALTETWKLVSDDRVQRIISNAMGREYAQLLKPWLRHIANDQARNASSNSTVVNVLRGIGHRITIVGLGYRFLSSIAQIAGMPNIIAQIGERRVIEGWGRFLANPVGAYAEVTGKSAEMRDRFSTMDRDIVEMARQQAKSRGVEAIAGPRWFTKYAYHGILIMDSLLTTAGWIGAYRKATAEGMSEEEAIYYADKVVRKSQGAGGAKDQAAITREHEAFKLFVKFFSYFSALYNQQRDFGHRLRRVSGATDLGRVMHFGFWIIVMPPLVDALIRGELPSGDDEDDESVGSWAAQKIIFGNLASIPFVRDVGGAIDRDFGYKATPVQNIGEAFVQGWNNIEKVAEGEEPSSSWLRQTITALGLAFGKPTGQIANTSQFGYDVATGEAEPETVEDYYEGATKGRIVED